MLLLAVALCVLQLRRASLGRGLGLANAVAHPPEAISVAHPPGANAALKAAEAQAPSAPSDDSEGQGILGRSPWTASLVVYIICFVVAKTEPPPPTGTPPKLLPDVEPLEKRRDYKAVLFMSTLLSLASGIVNALAIIEMGGTVAHHTGNASHVGRLLGTDALRFAVLMVAYLAGAALAGYCKVDGEALFARRYSPGMLSSAIAVAAGAAIFNASGDALVGLPLLSFSQGLQNAITRRCGSLPICTTHMTGYLTDAGAGLGLCARAGGRVPLKTKFFLISILAFVVGGTIAKVMRDSVGVMAALAPAVVMALCAFGLVPLPAPTAKE